MALLSAFDPPSFIFIFLSVFFIRQLVENIVVIGGTSMLPGFKERLSEELKNALETPRYSALAALKDAIKFHDPPAKANYTAWLGGEGLS